MIMRKKKIPWSGNVSACRDKNYSRNLDDDQAGTEIMMNGSFFLANK